eukprot:7324392-Alexandrium_andersonii.AAC.1
MRVVRQAVPQPLAWAVMKLWFNAWATRTRLHDQAALGTDRACGCSGCPSRPDVSLSHYLRCPALVPRHAHG